MTNMQYSLRALRINKKLTQKQAAEGLGISVETLASYEKGNTFPDIPTLKKIEEYYETNYNNIDFFCDKNTVKQ